MSTIKRKLDTVYTPPSQPGFLGAGHIARPVIQLDFTESDPFIMLMDDLLDKKDTVPVGGPHPHAGFETVTLILEGELGDGDHGLRSGDFEMMTAGSGIVHTEVISKPAKIRILQLWLNLPKHQRHATPRIQKLAYRNVPKTHQDGVSISVYSGTFGNVTSPVKNYTPITIADVSIKPNVRTVQQLPANFSTFLYVIEGSVLVGDEQKPLSKDQVGWLDRNNEKGNSELTLTAGLQGARFVLYAAEPQHHEIVSHGPFIADSLDEIKQLYADFRHGKMEHIMDVAEEQKLVH